MAKRTGAQTNLANGDDVDTEAGTVANLNPTALIRQVAEVVLRTVGDPNVDQAAIVNELRGILQPSPAAERVTGGAHADPGLEVAQWLFTQHEFRDKPYLRVFGRVMEILLHHRGFQTCTAGDIFRVFLAEIPEQLKEHPRQFVGGSRGASSKHEGPTHHSLKKNINISVLGRSGSGSP